MATMSNETRAERAGAVLAVYPMEDTPETQIIDLVADLLHYAHGEGFDAEAISRMALCHFATERYGIED